MLAHRMRAAESWRASKSPANIFDFRCIAKSIAHDWRPGPQPDLVRTRPTRQDDCQRGAPAPRAKDGDAAHFVFLSFDSCRKKIAARALRQAAEYFHHACTPRALPLRTRRRSPMAAAPNAAWMRRPQQINQQRHCCSGRNGSERNEPEENTTATKIRIAPRPAGQHSARNIPAAVATPLPPRNFSQTGKQWPASAANPDAVIHVAL